MKNTKVFSIFCAIVLCAFVSTTVLAKTIVEPQKTKPVVKTVNKSLGAAKKEPLLGSSPGGNPSYVLASTTPIAGAEGQIQYNSGSGLGANSGLTWDIAGGNLGVGTSTPTSRLTVFGGNLEVTPQGEISILGTYDTNGFAYSSYISGNFAYIADGAEGLKVVDVSDPTNPILVGSLANSSTAVGIYVSGRYAYMADNNDGLYIIDVIHPTQPVLVSTYPMNNNSDVKVVGQYAYVTDGSAGIRVLDVSNPSAVKLVSTYNTPGTPTKLFINGKYLYLADGGSGLEIYDISNPANITAVGNIATADNAQGVYVTGRYAYVAIGGTGFDIIDVSDPTAPELLSQTDTDGISRDLFTAGNYLYLADQDAHLKIFSVASSTAPVLIGGYSTVGTAQAVTIAGKYAYISDGNGGLEIFDITGILAPSATIGAIATGRIDISDIFNVDGPASIGGGLNVSGDSQYFGSLALSTTTGVLFDADNNLFRVGVGTSSPAALFSVGYDNGFTVNNTGSATSTEFEATGGITLGGTRRTTWPAAIDLAGNNGQIQFNDYGVLGADSNFSWNTSTAILNITGAVAANSIALSDGVATSTIAGNLQIANGKDLQVSRIYSYSPLNIDSNLVVNADTSLQALEISGVATSTSKVFVGTGNPAVDDYLLQLSNQSASAGSFGQYINFQSSSGSATGLEVYLGAGTGGSSRGVNSTAFGGTVENIGLRGEAYNADADNYGVFGEAHTGANNYGIYGTAADNNAYAGWFQGNVNITGTATTTNLVVSDELTLGGVTVNTWPEGFNTGWKLTNDLINFNTGADQVSVGGTATTSDAILEVTNTNDSARYGQYINFTSDFGSDSAYGLFSSASSTSVTTSNTEGIHGEAKSIKNSIFGAGAIGVRGKGAGLAGANSYGVFGEATPFDDGIGYGVYGISSPLSSPDNSTNYGLYGSASGGITNYGVYGTASGGLGENYAGYFDGDVTIDGNATTTNLEVTNGLTLGGVTKTSWPSGGSVAGLDEAIQFNNNGDFGGDVNLTWASSSAQLGVNGTVYALNGNFSVSATSTKLYVETDLKVATTTSEWLGSSSSASIFSPIGEYQTLIARSVTNTGGEYGTAIAPYRGSCVAPFDGNGNGCTAGNYTYNDNAGTKIYSGFWRTNGDDFGLEMLTGKVKSAVDIVQTLDADSSVNRDMDFLSMTPYVDTYTYSIENLTFDGEGLDDMTADIDTYASDTQEYVVTIDGEGTPDTFSLTIDGSPWLTEEPITGSPQNLPYGLDITFAATTGHTTGDSWTFSATKTTHTFTGDYIKLRLADESELASWDRQGIHLTDSSLFINSINDGISFVGGGTIDPSILINSAFSPDALTISGGKTTSDASADINLALFSTDGSNAVNILQNGTTPVATFKSNGSATFAGTAATTTLTLDASGAGVSCVKMKDSDGTGYTYLTAADGVLTASADSCE